MRGLGKGVNISSVFLPGVTVGVFLFGVTVGVFLPGVTVVTNVTVDWPVGG